MKVIKLKNLSKKDYQRIVQRSFGANEDIIPKVKKVIEDIKRDGDKVIMEKYQQRFGKDNYQSILVTKEEIRRAYQEIDKKLIAALKQMIKNITKVHQVQLPRKTDKKVLPEKGIKVWREWRPIDKVGLYIPGGKAVYPSSVLMSAIPAQIAGCRKIVLCSPPRGDGQIPSATLIAADIVGLTDIYKVGGVEAIAVMAYGTKTIPKVYKIFGAGNSYVTKAKMLVYGEVAIDLPAGPSEVMILIDKSANPSWVVADLLADAEHGSDSACIIVTIMSQKCAMARNCAREIERQLNKLPTADRISESLENYGAIIEADNLNEAIDFINEYAPEHLEIMVKNPEKIVAQIQNAGSVFLGNWTTKSAGDYATGANHVLPTGGMAKMFPPLGVDAFGRFMQVQKCTKEGLKKIRKTIEVMAETEQLPAHGNSVSIRFRKDL